ncbi:MAG: HK97 family phage prohead protease [Archaeoglobaceae archaeon]
MENIVKILYHKNIDNYSVNDEDKSFIVEGFIATTHLDTTNDKITKEALEKAIEFIKNSGYFTVLFNHDLNRPIGRIIDLELRQIDDENYGIYVKVLISSTETEIIQKIKEGILTKFSIGAYGTIEYDEEENCNIIKELYIFECSLVSVPANPNAKVVDYFVKYLSEEDMKEVVTFLKAMSVKINEKDIDYTPWSKVDKVRLKNSLLEIGDKRAIRECFGVVRSYERMGDWKFPHHVLRKVGDEKYELVLSYTGLMAAYKAFRGARSKPKLTSEEKEKLRRHLLRHFRFLVRVGEYNEIPEALKKELDLDMTLEEIIKDLETNTFGKEGLMMDEKELLEIFKEVAEAVNKSEEVEVECEDELEKEMMEEAGEYCEENQECPEEGREEIPEEGREEMVVSLDDIRMLIREELNPVITSLNEVLTKLNDITEYVANIQKNLPEKKIVITKTIKGVEEVKPKEDDIDLDDILNWPGYKKAHPKVQLQILKIVLNPNLTDEEKKQYIKNLVK